MPGRNGTGPTGAGAGTGRGLGPCAGRDAVRYGAGPGLGLGLGPACRRGFDRGFGRGYFADQASPETRKELLEQQKDFLNVRINAIDHQLENL